MTVNKRENILKIVREKTEFSKFVPTPHTGSGVLFLVVVEIGGLLEVEESLEVGRF